MKFRPCIDLHDGKVKQIVGSTLNKSNETNFSSDQLPGFFSSLYKKDHLPGGHIIMLGPGNEEAAQNALEKYPGGMQIGGGIDLSNAKKWLIFGASHVIITSYLFEDNQLSMKKLTELCRLIGKEKIVIDLSCGQKEDEFYVMTHQWSRYSSVKIESSLFEKLAPYCDEFLIHAVDNEGKRLGFNDKLVTLLKQCNDHSIVYAGGITSYQDIESIRKIHSGKLDYTVGSALDLFGGKTISYQELVTKYHDQ